IFAYLFMFAISFFIFTKLAPKQLRSFRDFLIHSAFLLGNFCLLCFSFMEIGDFFYNGSNSSKLGLPFMSLMRFGYNYFYISILSFFLCLLILLLTTIIKPK